MTERPLTPRQHLILRHIAHGATNKEIAAALNISEQGVKAHVSRLLERFDVENRVALVARSRAWADREDRSYEALSRDVDLVRTRLSGGSGGVTSLAAASPLAGDASMSPEMSRAIASLNGLLNEVDVAVKLARELPIDGGATGPLLEAVRTRVAAALEQTGRLAGLIERHRTASAEGASAKRA